MNYLYRKSDDIASSKSHSKQIKTVSAPSGSGKTRAMARQAVVNVKREFKKTIISSPTIILQQETVEMVRARAPNLKFRVFNHETCPAESSVAHELNQFFKS